MTNDTITVIQITEGKASQDILGEFVYLGCRIFSIHSLIVVVALVLVGVLWYKHRYDINKYISPQLLLWASVMVFVFGTFVYTVGSLQSQSMGLADALYTIPSAIISSLGMFFYQDDISELTDTVKGNSLYMACYSLAHFFAAIIMSFVILRLLGMRIVYWLKIKECCKHVEKLYIFWGISPQALTLAKSIHDKYNKSYIVLVNTIEEESEINSVHRLLDIIRIKGGIDDIICDIDAILVNCYKDIADSSVCKGNYFTKMVKEELKLNYLSKAIEASSELHLFFLSNVEDRNINSANNVIKIIENEGFRQQSRRNTHVYCHARHSAKTQDMDYHDIVKFHKEPKVHVIDSSALAIIQLKKNIADCPISFVNVDEATATVTSPFRWLIIGFGETGVETFNFLYEFGAFVDDKGGKTPFHCTIIDEKASCLDGDFFAASPELFKYCDIKKDKEIEEKGIRFEECPIGSLQYWAVVKREIEKDVNYIMVSVNDDDIGFNAAINICNKAVQWRNDNNSKLNVYVRCARQENYERILNVAKDMEGRYENITLKVFGDIKAIFNYETIVDDTILKHAKIYNWEYSKHEIDKETVDYITNKLDINRLKAERIDLCWIDKLKLVRTLEEANISNIEDSIRRRDQNISNVLHAATKLYILEKTGRGIRYWENKNLDREKDAPYYKNLSESDKTKLINIARLEHERWKAASILQGWQPTDNSIDKKDEIHKLHNDIRPWDELRSEGKERLKVQGYDCDVVDTTIKIEKIQKH